ncbi:DMT family transporter [Thalassotalea mangrovi]|uniref:DMT family transporter n=1 Tax=Thalassotalea mangrovi TaxID=2572245 RepID=A0A4U1B763_9GAMM|nr:DMT family transporter [Thalassotalea mangrovi]TKB46280.1 DMT family transporter [Thalassotalea mangrovi]
MNKNRKLAYLKLQLAVWLFSLCALFAYWVDVGTVHLVFGRTLFAALAIFLLLGYRQKLQWRFSPVIKIRLFVSALLLVIHWLAFFYVAQNVSVSTALITFASYPLWVLLIDWVRGNRCSALLMLSQSLLIIIGIALVSGHYTQQNPGIWIDGIVIGLVSAFTFALLTFVNQALLADIQPVSLTMWQNALATLFLIPGVLYLPFTGTGADIAKLMLLGVIFTAFAHSLLLMAMRSVPAFLVSVTVCLEPAYGILAAALLFAEPISIAVAAGIVLVLVSNVWAVREHSLNVAVPKHE